MKKEDGIFMAEALKEAGKAMKKGEVPVGAVAVWEGRVVGRGYNKKETALDPTAHAEIIALRKAAKRLGRWRLTGATLYVTLEPCIMCMGAIVQARVARLVFATLDPKAGACGSVYDINRDGRLNHTVEVAEGVFEKESKNLLKGFFSGLRAKRSQKNA